MIRCFFWPLGVALMACTTPATASVATRPAEAASENSVTVGPGDHSSGAGASPAPAETPVETTAELPAQRRAEGIAELVASTAHTTEIVLDQKNSANSATPGPGYLLGAAADAETLQRNSTHNREDGGALAMPKPRHKPGKADCGKGPGIGQPVKAFNLKTLSGKSTTHKSLIGHVTLVNFWGTWCKPCLAELPEFAALYRYYRKHGLAFIALATDADPVPVQDFVDSHKIPGRILLGAEDYASEYAASQFPFTFVVDHSGIIRGSYQGYRPECMGQLEADIRTLLTAIQ